MRKIILGILGVLLLVAVVYFIQRQMKTDDYSYVILTINPSVELAFDKDEIVREINSLNEDADILLSDLDLVGKSLEEVTNTIIDETAEINKLDNTIDLVVINQNEEKRLELENRIRQRIENHIQTKNYNATLTVKGVTNEIKDGATKYEIPNGHMMLVKKALELNNELKEEELVTKSVEEIQKLIKDASFNRREKTKTENNQTNIEKKESLIKQKEQLKKGNQNNN